jgi:hypothetical protein
MIEIGEHENIIRCLDFGESAERIENGDPNLISYLAL